MQKNIEGCSFSLRLDHTRRKTTLGSFFYAHSTTLLFQDEHHRCNEYYVNLRAEILQGEVKRSME